MTRKANLACRTLLPAAGLLWAAAVAAQPLTADGAVQLAFQHNTDIINSEANVLSARSGVYGAYSGVLPRVSAGISRTGSWQDEATGSEIVAGRVIPRNRTDSEDYSTTPSVSGSWGIFNFSAITGLSSAKSGLEAAMLSRGATRNDIALTTRRQFYEVVRAEHLANVSNAALRLARDEERRVQALFQVGSVSRSDVLSAQVRTAQSELDSLTARQLVTNQRIVLANQIGIGESALPPVDTSLVVTLQTYSADSLVQEASLARPDIAAAEKDLRSAELGLRSANMARWPYLTLTGGLRYQPRSSFKVTTFDSAGVPFPEALVTSGRSESDLSYSATVALNLDIFNGMQTESRIASARAQLFRSKETRDALRRNLAAEVDQALLAYNEAVERERVSRRALDAATENVRLTQQKYNVGSATILELITAQVALSRSASDVVSALATIRVAEAQIERVRGRAQ